MKNDLPDVELYHQERLCNLELRSSTRINKKSRVSALKDTLPSRNEEKEFVKNYARSQGYTSCN